MKKIIMALSLFSALSLSACEKIVTTVEEPQNQENNENEGNDENTGKKVLVAYFSFTNTTKGFATTIAEIAGADVYEIVPEVAYGSENSNYYDESTRAYKEQKNTGGEQRPAIKKTLQNADSYDVIFLGHPIWYSKAPRVIFTFLDAYGFKGKKVVNQFVANETIKMSDVLLKLVGTIHIVVVRIVANNDVRILHHVLDKAEAWDVWIWKCLVGIGSVVEFHISDLFEIIFLFFKGMLCANDNPSLCFLVDVFLEKEPV